MDGYAEWLASEIARLDEVDLIGHDWGGLLVLRVAADNPTNLRSWCVDSPNLAPTFSWHEGAQAWQATRSGEAIAEWLASGPDSDRLEAIVKLGVPRTFACEVVQHIDRRMTSSMLHLYRSATDIGTIWGPRLDAIRSSGLCIEAGQDPYRAKGSVAALAARLQCELRSFPDLGHFWLLQDPSAVARVLERFWTSL